MIQTNFSCRRSTLMRCCWAVVLALSWLCNGLWAAEDASRPATLSDIQRIQKQLKALAAEVQDLRKENVDLKKQVQELKAARPAAAGEELDLDRLRQAARAEAAAAPEPDEVKKDTIFKAKGLGLQALNPEISIAGDVYARYRDDHHKADRKQSDFEFRVLDVHIESYVDPYTRFKAAIGFDEHDAHLGEAYFTRYGILPDLSLTIGKFRQQFGVVNRWHKHALDQFDFPLALRQIFGDGGLNQTGLSLEWTMPSWGEHSQELILQVTDGSNSRVFGENSLNLPSTLLRYKNYWDVSKDTYAEVGLSALVGQNDEWDLQDGTKKHRRHWATVLGADFSLLWEPTERMRYRNVEWRTEAYCLNKGIERPDDTGDDTLNAWGAYSYIQTKLSRTWQVGIRGDYYQPDTQSYAELPGLSLSPLAVAHHGAYRWGVSPYLTWQPTPFLKCRLEYDHIDGKGMDKPDDILTLQFIFAVGPHKHERY